MLGMRGRVGGVVEIDGQWPQPLLQRARHEIAGHLQATGGSLDRKLPCGSRAEEDLVCGGIDRIARRRVELRVARCPLQQHMRVQLAAQTGPGQRRGASPTT